MNPVSKSTNSMNAQLDIVAHTCNPSTRRSPGIGQTPSYYLLPVYSVDVWIISEYLHSCCFYFCFPEIFKFLTNWCVCV